MKSITKTVYSFKELLDLYKQGKVSGNVVDKVRERLSGWNADSTIMTENVIDNTWKAVLEAVGFHNPQVSWSGFCSQGDGASFTSTCQLDRLIDWFTKPVTGSESYDENNLLPWLAHKVCQGQNPAYESLREHTDGFGLSVVRRNHNYSHERSCYVELDMYDAPDEIDKLIQGFMQDLEQLRLHICQEIYRDLNKENDHLTSDESLIEFDEANEYQWDVHGHQE